MTSLKLMALVDREPMKMLIAEGWRLNGGLVPGIQAHISSHPHQRVIIFCNIVPNGSEIRTSPAIAVKADHNVFV